MGFLDRLRGRRATVSHRAASDLMDLPLRRDAADRAVAARKAEAISMVLPTSELDPELAGFRRLTGGDPKAQHRDLTPMQQDKMLEVVWYLFEQNPLARRLITLMTDLVVGDGFTIEAKDPRVQAALDAVWTKGPSPLSTQLRSLHNGLSLNGELILPVALNEVTGKPSIGFIDPYVVKSVRAVPGNVLLTEAIDLKDLGGRTTPPLVVIRESAETGQLAGDTFFYRINSLPNATRGRSDLMPFADWVDLYDQFMFDEAQRASMLSRFVWDLKINGADDKRLAEERAKFPNNPKAGTVYAHNEDADLSARTPDLKAQDRGQLARVLRSHITGGFGYAEAWLGDAAETNRASLDGQNDVLLKTPSARQREFSGFIQSILRFVVEQAVTTNPSLYRNVDLTVKLRVPEIAAKDIARAGTAIAGIAAAMDTSLANGTMSKRVASTATLAMLRQLGIEEDPAVVLKEIDAEQAEVAAMRDAMLASAAAKRATPPASPAA